MKKIKIFVVLTLLSLTSIQAQSLSGYKICINPGHGGHDSNDREIPLGNGITFWESDGNLAKGLYVKTMLENLGANVVITRTTNNTEDDLPLSQIVAIANTNNVDYFHAIHSNASGTTTKVNYTLILFQGRTTVPTYPGSLTMANFLADNILASNRTTRKMIAGDFDFYGTGQPYLGVFKGLNMPGTLSEGSFHDYIPEAFRLKSEGYLKHEAWAIARSFLQYFKGGIFTDGIIAGIVRDELELVPTSYSPIATTNDRYKPINAIKVKLEPGGRTYAGDNFNNGYYLFDNVAPGNYKVIVEVDKMKPDTASVTVKANESVFSDRMMILNPILDPPKILSYSPADSLNEVSNASPIVIQFDIRMNTAVTQSALSISPAVDGGFQWDADYKKLTFTPSKGYTQGQKYIVKVSTAAKTHFGINLPNEKIFSFKTRSKLNLVSIYPQNGESNISTTVLARIAFEKGINSTTMAQKIFLTDSLGNVIPITGIIAKYHLGIIEFEPKTPLNENSPYKITVKEGIGDVEYVYSTQTYIVDFRTEKKYTFIGNLLEGFETMNVWQSPASSSYTKGIINEQTSFIITNTKKKSGENSGRLDYAFSSKDGIVDLALANPITLGESSSAEFGLWVFGDASKNILEFRFSRQGGSYVKVQTDTINWTGWKMKKLALNQIPGSGAIQLKSIAVLQTNNGLTSGRVYYDECLANIITDVKENPAIPTEFKLEQNYPNPFNPSTVISYQLSAFSHVSLKVYDILGREVATLVNEYQQAGSYVKTLRATSLPSGIYFYRLQTGNFVQTKKMLLVK